MSVVPEMPVDAARLEKTRQQINMLMEEVARLAERDIPPVEFFGEFLQRVLTGIAAGAGAVWGRTPQGHLQLQYQINMPQIFQNTTDAERQSHDELLRMAVQKGQPLCLSPRSGPGPVNGEGGGEVARVPSNPTAFVSLIAPVLVDNQVSGLVEVWQDPMRHPQAQRGFLGFIVQMSALAGVFLRNHQMRHLVGQQQVWTQLEAFALQIHGSLNPTEVAYQIATEGRRIIDCDRISVALRQGRKPYVAAISGADVVEKRSSLVQRMRALFEQVMKWGEKLVYNGVKDDALPPDVLKALDAYLTESNSKLLVVLPQRDERESKSKRLPRSAVMLECFEPALAPDQLVSRLEIIARHSTTALYNASEHRRIPGRYIWQPIAYLQEGLGGKARAITAAVIVALAVLVFLMAVPPTVLPLPFQTLKMDSKGQLLPVQRRWVFAPVDSQVIAFEEHVKPGAQVGPDQSLALMYGMQLDSDLRNLDKEIDAAKKSIDVLNAELQQANKPAAERSKTEHDLQQKKVVLEAKVSQRDAMRARTNSDQAQLGYFRLKAPPFPAYVALPRDPLWTILNWDFKETLTNRGIKPSDPLLHLGNKEGPWEIELKIPQKHIGQILAAFDSDDPRAELDVDLLLLSKSTLTFKGKLARGKIAGEAVANHEDAQDAEPVVLASVRIEGDDIPKDVTVPRDLLQTGIEVHAKVRCGKHALGYSLFYGVWEFIYEKIVFFF